MYTDLRKNNFDFLRILFASLVIVSHSYPLLGYRDEEILRKLTNNQIDFGGFSVKCFFIISGYLIYQSIERSSTFKNYIWKRLLRLYPGFITMLLFLLLFIGIVYSKSNVLSNWSFWTYMPRQLSLFFLQDSIEGVFDNLKYMTVNGSIWTICYEFLMYLIFGAIFFVKKKYRLLILIVVFVISFILITFFPEFLNKRLFALLNIKSYHFYELMNFFSAGAILTHFSMKKKLLIGISFVALIISIYFNQFGICKFFVLPILVISFGANSFPYINSVGDKIGDVSYGVYIYGWPIQQFLIYFFDIKVNELIIYSLLIGFVFGWISWRFVEQKALKYKNLIH